MSIGLGLTGIEMGPYLEKEDAWMLDNGGNRW